MEKTTILVGILAFIIVIGAFVYFVSGVSATIPPIKKYQYMGSMNRLITGLGNYASKTPDMTFKITDTAGNRGDGYAIYMNVKMIKDRHQFEYHLKCEENDSKPTITKTALVFAYDATNNSGGYGMSATGINVLIENFDNDFLPRLKTSQNIELSAVKPTFLDPLKHVWNGD